MEDQGHQSRLQSSRLSQQPGARSSPGLPQHRRFDESWVEVSSQPSSSSLSSIGDEIVTTGLRVGGPYARRRRLTAPGRTLSQHHTALHTAGASSQEDYDESESEDDQLLTSSTEAVQQQSPEDAMEDSDADSDDGDNATALGRVSDKATFQPQPNAFSHPPAYLAQRSHSATSAMPPHPHSGFTRPSFSQRSQTRVHRGAPSFMSPSVREDNDAALRASLTTLLSCAAAARGLPKTREEAEAHRPASTGVAPSDQPMGLRLVPESELLMEEDAAAAARSPAAPGSQKRDTPARSPRRTSTAVDKSKRAVSAGRSPRATKKKKTAVASDEALISPTLLTWVVSAGVVVLVSVVGFGAGYVIGREVGRQEALAVSVGSVNETSSCGREVIRSSSGLRRFRWGAVGKSIVASG